jgi:hypothetical protein
MSMGSLNIPARTPADFKEIYGRNGFWSTLGYDGLSLVFGVPLEAIQSLSEQQKRSLLSMVGRLADSGNENLAKQVVEAQNLDPEDRIEHLVKLSELFAA